MHDHNGGLGRPAFAAFRKQEGVSPLLWLLLVAIPIIVTITGVTTQLALSNLKRASDSEVQRDLQAILNTTHTALDIWFEERRNFVTGFASDTTVISLTEALLALPPERSHLLGSDALQELRKLYRERTPLNNFGFKVITPGGITLAAKQDNSIGLPNPVTTQRPELLARLFAGETVIIPLGAVEDASPQKEGTEQNTTPALLIATPIRNRNGRIIAAFALCIDPAQSFAQLVGMGDRSHAISSYALDASGRPYLPQWQGAASHQLNATAAHLEKQLARLMAAPGGDGAATLIDMEGYVNGSGTKVIGALLWDSRYELALASEMESALAENAFNQSRASIHSLFYTVTFIAILTLIITLLFIRHITRQMAQSQQALEQRVHERTAELIQANAHLQAAKDEIEGTLAAIPDVIIQIDERGVISGCNDNAERLLGYTRQELTGMELETLVPEALRQRHRLQRQTMMSPHTGTIKPSRPLQVRSREGELIDIEINVNSFRVGERWMAVAGIRDIRDRIRDQNEKEKYQQQLAQSSKMRTLGQLTGGIAHDFNNMLTSIMGFAELSLHAVPTGDEKLGRYMELIMQSGQRASDLVRQMLAFSQGGGTQIQVLLPAPIIKDAVKMLRAALPSSFQLVLNLQAAEARISSEPSQLYQIVTALVINARDSLAGKGRIEIGLIQCQTAGLCDSCHTRFSGGFIELYAQDDGPGGSADPRPLSGGAENSQEGETSLANLRTLIHSCGGHIVVESHPQGGTRVRLLFPEQGEGGAESTTLLPLSPESSPRKERHHLLIVDDEKSITTFMSELLEAWNLQVSAFNNATDALNAFQMSPQLYDLIITDQTMPLMLGSELSVALRRIRPGIPIILYSGHSEQVNEENYRHYGIDAFFHKPLNSSALYQTIRRLLDPAQMK